MTEEATWLTLTEAAERLGVRRELLRSRARRGLIPSRRNNRGEMLVQIQPGQDQAMTGLATMPPAGPMTGVTGLIARPAAGLTAEETGLIARLEDELAEVKAELADRREAQAKAEERALVLREALDFERGRTNRLEEEIREMRRPWWRRWWS
jgi:hypothetical protein